MFVVLFRLDPGQYDGEFHELNDAIQDIAEDTSGYRGKRTWHDPDSGEVLVVYYWESLEALSAFGDADTHRRAKARWSEWYDAYDVTITEIRESYGSGFGPDAGPPS